MGLPDVTIVWRVVVACACYVPVIVGPPPPANAGPPNVPTWFVIPHRTAGYPVYMPQMPLYAAGGSSDYVNGWGDYRWNNFYEQNGFDEPTWDPVYDPNAPWVNDTTTPNPDDVSTSEAPADADASTEAAAAGDTTAAPAETTARPAREFHDLAGSLSNMIAHDPRIKPTDVTNLLLQLMADFNATVASRMTTTTTRMPLDLKKIFQSNRKVTTGTTVRRNAASRLSAPVLVHQQVPPNRRTPKNEPSPFVFLNAVGANFSSTPAVVEKKSFDANASRSSDSRIKTIWDLFQIAVARVPSPANGGFIVSGSPLFRTRLRNPTDSNGTSSNSTTGSTVKWEYPQPSENVTTEIPVTNPSTMPSLSSNFTDTTASIDSAFSALVLPMVLSSLGRLTASFSSLTVSPSSIPLTTSPGLSLNSTQPPLAASTSWTIPSLFLNTNDTVHKQTGNTTGSPLFADTTRITTPSTAAPLDSDVGVSLPWTSSTFGSTDVSVNFTTSSTIENSSAVAPESNSSMPLPPPGMLSLMQRRGLCSVEHAGQRILGVCVAIPNLQEDCDGLAIKRSPFCLSTMSCCYDVTLPEN